MDTQAWLIVILVVWAVTYVVADVNARGRRR